MIACLECVPGFLRDHEGCGEGRDGSRAVEEGFRVGSKGGFFGVRGFGFGVELVWVSSLGGWGECGDRARLGLQGDGGFGENAIMLDGGDVDAGKALSAQEV